MTNKQHTEAKKEEAKHLIGRIFKHKDALYQLMDIKVLLDKDNNYELSFYCKHYPPEHHANGAFYDTKTFANEFHEA